MTDRQFADRIPAPRPVPTTRHRLDDARSHALEVERDDLHIQTGRLEADNRAMMRDRDQALAERDDLRAEINRVEQTRQEQVQALNAKLQDALWTAGQHATTAASLRQQLDQATAERDQARRLAALTAEQEAANAQIIVDTRAERDRVRDRLAETRFRLTRTEQELGAAGDVLAVVRDAAERIDRALAAYDTTPSEGSVTITLDNSAGTFTPRHPGDALADALRNAYTTGQLGLLHERVVDLLDDDTPREDPLGRLVDALFAARHKPTPPALGSPPPRAQEEPTAADLLRQAAAGRREYAKAIPEKAEPLDLQAHTLDAAAQVVEGDLAPLYDWLPSWRWTPEMHARLHPEREG